MFNKNRTRKYIAMILSFVMVISVIVPSNMLGTKVANAADELQAYINNFDPDVFTGGYSMGGDGNAIGYAVQADQGVTGSAISLTYTRAGSWGPVYHTNIPSEWDLTGTQSIIFNIKGDGVPVNMYIGVEEEKIDGDITSGSQFRKLISVSGNEWNQITIPVAELEYQQNGDGVLDLDKVNSINISVETDGAGVVLIDDFTFYKSGPMPSDELQADINNFDPDVFTGGYGMGGDGSSIVAAVQENQGVTGSAISLTYTRAAGSWGPIYQTSISSEWDLTETQAIIFNIKGDGQSTNMFIGVEEPNGGDKFRKEINISGNEWNQINIPVNQLLRDGENGNGTLDWNKVRLINISFESNTTGVVLIDNFTFYKSGKLPSYLPEYSMPVILQNFNNDDTGNWSVFKDSDNGASLSLSVVDPGKSGKAIQFNYISKGWGSVAARSTGTNSDWSKFTGISFWAKGEAGQQFKFKFEEDSLHADEWAKTVTLASNDWEQINIKFTDEFEMTNAWNGNKPDKLGTINFDNIINYGFTPMGADGVAGSFSIDEIILTSPVEGCTLSDVSTNVLGSIFTNNQISLNVGISNFGAAEVQKTIGYEVKDIDGVVLFQDEKLSTPINGLSEGTDVISFTVEKYGYYTVDVFLLDEQGEKDIVVSKPFVFLKPSDNNLTKTAKAGVGYSTHYDYLNENQINMEAQLIKLSGANLARQDFLWDMLEPAKGQFDWSFYDKVVDINYSNDIDTIGLLCYSTPWSSTVAPNPPANDIINHYPPEELGDFAEYVYQTVSRYKNKVHSWEIWNEPNLNGFFRPTNSPEAYYELLRAGYLAAKRADPTAKVVMAGLSGTGSVYMQKLLDLGAADYTDALVIHPYQAGDPETGNSFANDILGIRQKAPDKNMWITEWGWQTKEFDLKKQAVYTAKGYVLALAAGVENIALYSFNQATDSEYGLVNASVGGMVKPIYATVNALNGALAGREYIGDVVLDADVKAYAFTKSGELPMLAVWSSTNKTIEIDSASDSVLYDMYGNAQTIQSLAGKLSINLTNEPQYLIGDIESAIGNATPKFAKTDSDQVVPMKSWQTKSPYYSRVNSSITRGVMDQIDVEVYNYQNKTIKGLLKIEDLPNEWFGNELNIYKAYEVLPYSKQIVSFDVNLPETAATGVYHAQAKDISTAGNFRNTIYDINVQASLGVVVNKNSINLTNNISKEVSGDVVFDTIAGWTVTCAQNAYTLQPGETVSIDYSLTPSSPTQSNGELTLSGNINAGEETIAFSQRLFTFVAEPGAVTAIDGVKDSQWDGAIPVALDKSEQVSIDYVTYSELNDLSANMYAKWDSEYLYLLAEVKDDIHLQPSSGGAMWQGDSLQVAFDATNTGIGDYPGGNELQVGKNVLGVDEFNKAIANSLVAINRDDVAKTTTYEMRIPFAVIEGMTGITNGKAIGFSMLINDNDGSSREGYMEWSSGIGAAKSTKLFGTLFLK